MSPQHLDAVIHFLVDERFAGVLTLEIFGPQDWAPSRCALDASVARYAPGCG
jgi:hypothetical protein